MSGGSDKGGPRPEPDGAGHEPADPVEGEGPSREHARDDVAQLSHAFFAMASHELRSPLQALGLHVSMMRERVAGSADELPREWLLDRLERTQRVVDQTVRLLELLLNGSEISDGRLVLRLETLDLADLVRSVVNGALERLRWAGCACDLDAAEAAVGRFDRLRLELVVENLIANAMKYAARSRIHVAVRAEGGQVVLAVADDGPGIARADQARIFERFERGAHAGSVAGFGLGLWIVRTIAEAHGGTVLLESEHGAGARFTVTLPRDGPPARGG